MPAAIEGVLTGENAPGRGQIVVEGANGPTTRPRRILSDRGVVVVPDILANAGGVVVSYFEWVQANQAYWWSKREVEDRLEQRCAASWEAVTQAANVEGSPCGRPRRPRRRARDRGHVLRGLYP